MVWPTTPSVPPVVITDFLVFDEPLKLGLSGAAVSGGGEPAEIVLAHDQSVLSIEFTALSYRNPEKNRFAYKLEGFDEAWVDSRTRRRASYTNLDPGRYTFLVKGSNDSGVWNETPAAIRLQIRPPFWQTWWARSLGVLVLVSSAFAWHRLRTRAILKRSLALEEEVGRRTRVERELEQILSTLEQSHAELETKNAALERYAYAVSHDLQSPLVTIGGFVGCLARDAEAGDTASLQSNVRRIARATETMRELLSQVLEHSRAGERAHASEHVSLGALAREASELVAGRLEQRGVEVHVDPGLPFVWVDRVRVREVFQNLLENAAKFMGDQQAPRVQISASADGDEVTCSVADNGIGIDPRYHDKVFGLFDRLDPQTPGTGIGLALVKRVIEAHGGRIWIESKGSDEGGTRFFFTLPGVRRERASD